MYTAREGKKKGVWDLWPQAAPPLGDWSSLSLSLPLHTRLRGTQLCDISGGVFRQGIVCAVLESCLPTFAMLCMYVCVHVCVCMIPTIPYLQGN